MALRMTGCIFAAFSGMTECCRIFNALLTAGRSGKYHDFLEALHFADGNRFLSAFINCSSYSKLTSTTFLPRCSAGLNLYFEKFIRLFCITQWLKIHNVIQNAWHFNLCQDFNDGQWRINLILDKKNVNTDLFT